MQNIKKIYTFFQKQYWKHRRSRLINQRYKFQCPWMLFQIRLFFLTIACILIIIVSAALYSTYEVKSSSTFYYKLASSSDCQFISPPTVKDFGDEEILMFTYVQNNKYKEMTLRIDKDSLEYKKSNENSISFDLYEPLNKQNYPRAENILISYTDDMSNIILGKN